MKIHRGRRFSNMPLVPEPLEEIIVEIFGQRHGGITYSEEAIAQERVVARMIDFLVDDGIMSVEQAQHIVTGGDYPEETWVAAEG